MTSPPALPMAPQPEASASSASGLFGPFNELPLQ